MGMNGQGMNCAASSGCEAAQEIVKELKKNSNKDKLYDVVSEEMIDLTNNWNDNIPGKKKLKLTVLHWLKGFVITIFALAVVLGGYWLLFRIIS
jgi:flavin-dependent dehydrogenase